MKATLVHIHVLPECREAFIKASLDNATNSNKEPLNIRFDFMQSHEDENYFIFYEVFAEGGLEAHKETAHYQRWRDTVNDMMAETRKGVPHELIFPQDLA